MAPRRTLRGEDAPRWGRAELKALQWRFAETASMAGRAVMDVFDDPRRKMRRKADGSPVSDADERAEEIILRALHALLPGVAVLAEESASRGQVRRGSSDALLLVDPVDGTREFAAGRREFTVNIALVLQQVPAVGCVYAPALGEMYLGCDRALACRALQPGQRVNDADFASIRARRTAEDEPVAVVASRSHADDRVERLIGRLPVARRLSAGSSLKFCLVASGRADLYPRFGTTMEWDTAAGHAVLHAAGGEVRVPDGRPLRYDKHREAHRNGSFIAYGTGAYTRFGTLVAGLGAAA